ncbi:hypothetical protein SCLCIDRAFT_22602 [Scleroderma citrinum Foug A]|uniref:Uncharacterized protein n=1 Tax=Scleroderma citrinum Foug A TaxID=1036808 RepID=A0A0C3DYV7_9AGAM|nr:hypothetical protein SCLCIDRAFT_22602 [Scleroderma citrinum Foug A]
MAEKTRHCLTQPEIYLKNYYEEQIKPTLEAKIKAGNIEDIASAQLSMRQKLSIKLLAEEMDDVKEVVKRLYSEQKRDKLKPVTAETNPEKILQRIEDLPILLQCVEELIYDRTGFIITYLCTGPNLKNDWNISTTSYHVGKTLQGHDFSAVYPTVDHDILTGFIDFAELVYSPDQWKPPEERQAWSTDPISTQDSCDHNGLKDGMDRMCREEIGVGGGVGRSGARVGLSGEGLYMLDNADDASLTTNDHNVAIGSTSPAMNECNMVT